MGGHRIIYNLKTSVVFLTEINFRLHSKKIQTLTPNLCFFAPPHL